MCVSGGASLPVEILHGFARRFGRAVLEGFGAMDQPGGHVRPPGRPRKAVDRKKDMIIRGGCNVTRAGSRRPCTSTWPTVALAVVVGVPHTHLGEEIAAAVVLRPAAHATPDELRDFVKDRVAALQDPREVRIVDTLPTGPSGKILKREIVAPAR